MMIGLRIALVTLALLVTTPAAAAKPMKPDCAAGLAAVQSAVAGSCDCAAAATHGQYVRCAVGVVKGMAHDGAIGKSCKGSMVRTFAKSTCGRPDAVTCCVPKNGATACSVKKAAICAKRGGVPGATPLCVDACNPASPSGAFVN